MASNDKFSKTYNERERIIFMHDIKCGFDDDKDVAKQLSKQYPQLVIFTDPYEISNAPKDALKREELDDYKNVYKSNDLILGAHIYKNGVRYTMVRGINPYYSSITVGNDIIS